MKKLPKIIAIVGPTASGKTDLAIFLAKKFNGEIVNADSRSIYKGMYIGTASPFAKVSEAKPRRILQVDGYWLKEGGLASTLTEVSLRHKSISHHLFHFVEPWEAYSVGQYKQDAIKAMNDILARGKVPILVGGTGLYIWAIVDNLEIPEVLPNEKLRQQLMKPSFVLRLRQKLGFDKVNPYHNPPPRRGGGRRGSVTEAVEIQLRELLWDTLIRLDPEAASFVQKDNPRRVIRALEVILTINKSLNFVVVRHLAEQKFGLDASQGGQTSIIKFSDLRKTSPPLFWVLQIGVKKPRQELYKKIDARVEEQIKQGLVRETKRNHFHIQKNVKIAKKLSFGLRLQQKLSFDQQEWERVWQLPSMTSLGYRQIGMYLRALETEPCVAPACPASSDAAVAEARPQKNKRSALDKKRLLDEAIRILKRDTRRYSRRQMTWFRRDKRIIWLADKKKTETVVRNFLKSTKKSTK